MDSNEMNDWYASTRDEADKLAAAASRRSGDEWAAVDCSFQFTDRWAIRRTTDGSTLSRSEARQLETNR